MNEPATTIALPGLNHAEADELATVLRRAGADPASNLDVQRESGDAEDEYGEPFTLLAVIALGQLSDVMSEALDRRARAAFELEHGQGDFPAILLATVLAGDLVDAAFDLLA